MPAFLDFDRDGWLDLFVCAYVNFSYATHKECFVASGRQDYCGPLSFSPLPDRLYRNRGDGTFEDVSAKAQIVREYGSGLGVVCADFNQDGWTDIYVANDADRISSGSTSRTAPSGTTPAGRMRRESRRRCGEQYGGRRRRLRRRR